MADLVQPDPNSLQIPCKTPRSLPLQIPLTRFQAHSTCFKALQISTLESKVFINRNPTFASCFELSVVSETQENQWAILNKSYSGFCHLLFRRWLHQYNFSACTFTSSFLCLLFFFNSFCYYYSPIPLSINSTWNELHPSQIPALREQYIKLIVTPN